MACRLAYKESPRWYQRSLNGDKNAGEPIDIGSLLLARPFTQFFQVRHLA